MISSSLSPDSGPPYDILNPADVADVLRILFRKMMSEMHLKLLISIVLSRLLVMVVSTLLSMA